MDEAILRLSGENTILQFSKKSTDYYQNEKQA